MFEICLFEKSVRHVTLPLSVGLTIVQAEVRKLCTAVCVSLFRFVTETQICIILFNKKQVMDVYVLQSEMFSFVVCLRCCTCQHEETIWGLELKRLYTSP
jgi:hypothetical protein